MIWKTEKWKSPNKTGKKKKKPLRNENNLIDLRNNIKHTNIHIIEVPEREKRENRVKNITWWNYSWKLSKSEEGTESMEGPKQDEPKQTHTKLCHN